MDRARDFVVSTPFVTLALLFVNVFVHIAVFLFTIDISPFTFSPHFVVYEYQYYRIFTSAFLHGGILHIAMNMMSLVAMGGLLEPTYGSLRFLWMTWASIFLTAFCYIFFAWLSSVLMQDGSYMNSNSIGYSGVLFSYTAIESFHASSPYRSVFGLFSVPTKIYPIILLIVIQFVLPNISFFGHLGGLCAGLLLISSVGEYCVMPSLAAFEKMETSCCCSACRRQSSFRLLTNASLLHPLLEIRCQRNSGTSDSHGLFGYVQGAVSFVQQFVVAVGYVLVGYVLVTVGQLLYTICYIFGFPIDFCLHRMQQAYESLQRCVSNSCTRVRGFFVGSTRNPGDIETPADPANAPTATQRSRLVSVPTVISSTPFSRPSTSSLSGGGSDGHSGSGGSSSGGGGGGGNHSSTSSTLANAAMRLGGSSFANYGGYEMVSQDIPESHATNCPLQPTSTAATASQRASTMLETMEEDDEAVAASAAATVAPKATSASSTTAAKTSTTTTTTTTTTAAAATAGNVQYYHRSKQTSRLLNPELYSVNAANNTSNNNTSNNNSNNNSSSSSSNSSNNTPRPPGGSGAKSTPR